jgi:hypothetical protein
MIIKNNVTVDESYWSRVMFAAHMIDGRLYHGNGDISNSNMRLSYLPWIFLAFSLIEGAQLSFLEATERHSDLLSPLQY